MKQEDLYNDFSSIALELPTLASGFSLVTYSIALEAWRRGIELKFYSRTVKNQVKIFYSLKNDFHDYKFQNAYGGNIEKSARNIVNSKERTKDYLEAAGVSVPKGKKMDIKNDFKKVFSYASSIGYPVVVKPINGRLGKGVFTNLKNEKELETALIILKDKLGYTEIMTEQHIKGEDTRVYVIENEVIASYKRRPANVIGNGTSNIKTLIKEKNKLRQKNPHAKKFKIEINGKITDYLQKHGLSLKSIPSENEIVYLTDSTLHPDGCEVVDTTNELSEKMKKTAIEAVKAIPGMKLSGLDIMIDHDRNEGFVLELNASPNIVGHFLPLQGQPRDVPKAFIDYHFPETITDNNIKCDYFTFDFDTIIKTLKSGAVNEVKVPALPKGNLVAKEYTITGKVDKLPSWIHSKATGLQLGGEITKLRNNQLIVKSAGKKEKISAFTKVLKNKNSSNTRFEVTEVDKWNGLYSYFFKKLGIKDGMDNNINKMLLKENERLTLELRKLKDENMQESNELLSRELKNIKNSRSWKVTQPMRKITSKIRKRKQ